MQELEKFERWVLESPWHDDSIRGQADAYLQTFPGRMLQLVVELLEAAERRKDKPNDRKQGNDQP